MINTTDYKLICLFAEVINDEAIKGLINAYDSADPDAVANGAVLFYRALAEGGYETAADYMAAKLRECETLFSRAAAQGKEAKLVKRADSELDALKRITEISSDILKDKMPESARNLFPKWKSGTLELSAKTLAAQYRQNGYGAFTRPALLFDEKTGKFAAVKSLSPTRLSDLKEYAEEKAAAVNNTLAFIDGRKASNVLFYGDRGTGKSSTVQALINEYHDRGLRLIQLNKSAIPHLGAVKEKLAEFPYLKFVLFFDDLTFSADDDLFSALKAEAEGGLSAASNALIYVTTNRRHLVKESLSARECDDVHAADTAEEQLSLFDRFGLVITYIAPDKKEYVSILQQILRDRNIELSYDEAASLAERYALRKGGRTPRAAKQLADMIESEKRF